MGESNKEIGEANWSWRLEVRTFFYSLFLLLLSTFFGKDGVAHDDPSFSFGPDMRNQRRTSLASEDD
jgi:hypothetical protein